MRPTDMKVQITLRTVYGREYIYPVNDSAKTFSQLCGGKTLALSHIDLIKKLGFEIEVVSDTTNSMNSILNKLIKKERT